MTDMLGEVVRVKWVDAKCCSGIHTGEEARDRDQKGDEALVAQLYQQIGRLKVERDFVDSALGR